MNSKDQAFEALVHAYSADIYRIAYWLCKHASLAEDMTQETFARAWKSLDKLVDERAAKAWLITILRNEIARYFSRKQADILPFDELPVERNINDTTMDAQSILELRDAILKLDSIYREPLILQVIGGYSSKEIAAILDVQPAVVLTRVCRARQQLRKALDPATITAEVVKL